MIVDIIFVIFLVAGFWHGFRNGIIYAVFSVVGVFFGILLALKFSYVAVNLLHAWLSVGPRALVVTSFVLVLALVTLFFRLIGMGLEQILKSFSLNLPNKIIGGLIYATLGLYMFCICIWFVSWLRIFPQKQKATSYVYPHANKLAPKVVEVTGRAIPFFSDGFNDFITLFNMEDPDEKLVPQKDEKVDRSE